MSASLEARVPYMDHLFVEQCAQLSPGWKRHGSIGKYAVKRVAERYLPKSLVHRRKQGFTLPFNEWFRGPLNGETVHALSVDLPRRGLVRKEYLLKLLDQQRRGTRNHTGRLWSLLILEKWFKRYASGFSL
jgi:asparagine synthase (glutamine-hydrolysing)